MGDIERFITEIDVDLKDLDFVHVLKVVEEEINDKTSRSISGTRAQSARTKGKEENYYTILRGSILAGSPNKLGDSGKVIKASEECRLLSFGSDLLWE